MMNLAQADVEDVYALSPLQEGMLFHSLSDPSGALFFLQTVIELGEVDADAFRRAWQRLTERHAIFRTTFHWEDLDKPVQVVHRRVEAVVDVQDWTDANETEQAARYRDFLRKDRSLGIKLDRVPMHRLTLIRLAPNATRFLWSHHHILMDGWSRPIIFRELFAFFEAFRRGQDPDLPRPKPYREYINWLQRQDMAEVERFWRKELAGFTAPTPLPGERLAGKGRGDRFEQRQAEVPEAVGAALNALARETQITPNTIVQAAWAILLARYAGVDDVVFGSVVSGRPPLLEGSEGMVGMFINSLAVRIALPPDETLVPWLKRLQLQQFDRTQYEHSPIIQVQRWSEVPAGTPLYESLVLFENFPRDPTQPKGDGKKKPKKKSLAEERTTVPLLLSVTPEESSFSMQLIYDGTRFDSAAAARLIEHYQTILEQIAFHPELRLADVSLLSEAERQRILVEWNDTATDYPRDKCLHQLLESQASSTPDAIALSYEDEDLSYRELNGRANRIAHHLRALGVTRGTLVGICVERSIAMATSLLAVLKSGGAYVPLDPHYPASRLAFMLQDTQAPLVLVQEKYRDRLPADVVGSHCRVISLERDAGEWEKLPDYDLDCVTGPSDLAYVLFTSGSTGQPKGVAIPHRVSVNRVHIEHDPFEPGEVLPVKTSLNFVDSLWELFSAWRHGLKAVMVPDAKVQDPAQLIEVLSKCEATRIVLVPSLLRSILHSGIDLAAKLPKLRHWIPSGEPLPPDLCRTFAEKLPGRVLTNLYGTSEVWDATRCDSRERPAGDPLPIGRPLGNMRVYVLDSRFQPVPVGIPGELFVGGVGLADGYWKRPELTATKFVPDPYSPEPGGRMYRSGDRVRWLADGNLEFLGRVDFLVKVRGFRIELGEVEAVLMRHPAVRQCTVTVTPDEQLAAYVVAVEGGELSVPMLRDFARTHLPEPMVPAFFIPLAKLPLTPSGKVDRKALPAPEARRDDQGEVGYVEPSTDSEKAIALVLAEVLRIDRVGAHDNFFQLGGHSILATRATLKLSKTLGVEIPVRSLFDAPTVAGLAVLVETIRNAPPPDPNAPKLEAGAAPEKEAPLSFAQQRLWFLDQLDPGSLSYTLPNPVRLNGPLDVPALEAALTELVRRHESLRTTFGSHGGQPFQIIGPPTPVTLPIVSLAGLPGSQREAEGRRYAREMSRQPWDLARGPLVRLQLLRLGADEHLLLLTMHHIITDGWSMGIFAAELAAIYRAFTEGRGSPLPEPTLQYADYAVWQRKFLQGEMLEKQLGYWREKLGGAATLELPTDHPRPAVHRYKGAREDFTISAETADRLRALSKSEGTTLFMTTLAAFQVFLGRYSGQDDISVGTPIANRNRVELERLIGFFANTLVMRTDLSGNPSFREILGRARTTCLDAYEHQEVPFERLVEELKPERDLSRQPLFQVMFILQNPVRSSVNAGGLNLAVRNREMETANFDLLLLLVDGDAGMTATLQYNTDLFDRSTAERMTRHLGRLLDSLAADADLPIGKAPLLDEAERKQLLVEWNATDAPVPTDRCVHELVEAHAKIRPDHFAVNAGDAKLTFGELDRRANQLARRLQRLGVGPERIVGMLLPRSPDAIVSLLGIMKAGGAYLPLDTKSPRERLAHQLRDAKPVVVVGRSSVPEVVAESGIAWLDLDAERESLASEPTLPVASGVSPSNLAYIIYTSGSTGLPKGVMVEHQSFVNLVTAHIPLFQVGPESRVLQMIALTFDASLGEIFRALASGATLYQPHEAASLPGPEMLKMLKDERISVVALPPSLLAAVPEGEELPDLRTLTVGGESCPPELALRWGRRRRLLNGYGPTETTVGATLAIDWDPARKPPLGRPLPNVRTYVLDRNLEPTPIGVVGELYIGGAGVTRGYLNNPELTSERFLADPFSPIPGARFYRTGDQARWLATGELDFLGRVDQQVKIRGFRIELGEIEAALGKHESVKACAVDARDDGPNHKRLVGYVVLRGEPVPSTADFRAFLKDRVPDYMVPATFVNLAALPLTTNGKVDRKALPTPDFSRKADEDFQAPEEGAEATLAGIWADVLRLDRVGRRDNFFELGGDSILSIQVIARAAEAGLRLTPKDLFQHQTIADLAAVVGTGAAIAAEQGLVTGDVPLTPIQRWFFEANPPEPQHFNHAATLPATPDMDMVVLERAVRRVAEHHDALRMRFRRTESGWEQFVADPGDNPVSLVRVDLANVPDEELQERADAATLELHRSLNLTDGPLVRLAWLDMGHRGSRVLLIVHHLLVDTVSWRIIMEDLMNSYRQLRGKLGDAPVRLPAKTTSYKQWAESLVAFAASDATRQEAAYWLDPRRSEAGRLPLDFQGENTKESADLVKFTLSSSETRALLHEVPQAFKTQINDVLLTALARSLAEWTRNPLVVVDLEGHGREEIGVEVNISRTVGWFTSFYPLLLDLRSAASPAEAIKAVKEQIRDVPGRGIGYLALRYLSLDAEVRSKLQASALADVAFNYLGQQGGAAGKGRGRQQQETAQEGEDFAHSKLGLRRHVLEINGIVRQGSLHIRWGFSKNLHDRATVEKAAKRFADALRELIEASRYAPQEALSAADFPTANLSQDELDALMAQLGKKKE